MMLINKKIEDKGFVNDSFHSFVIKRMKTDHLGSNWKSLTSEEKLSRSGLTFVTFLDRLSHAEFDLDEFWSSYNRVVDTINRSYLVVGKALVDSIKSQSRLSEQEMTRIIAFEEMQEMNQQNLDLSKWIEENDEETYEMLYILGKGFFTRFFRLKELFIEAGLDSRFYVIQVQQMVDTLGKIAKHLDVLALRHFYPLVIAGKYTVAAAICIASQFLYSVVRGLQVYLIGDVESTAFEERSSDFDREYHIPLLCSFGRDFSFKDIDDDTSPLHPDVADMLFPDRDPR